MHVRYSSHAASGSDARRRRPSRPMLEQGVIPSRCRRIQLHVRDNQNSYTLTLALSSSSAGRQSADQVFEENKIIHGLSSLGTKSFIFDSIHSCSDLPNVRDGVSGITSPPPYPPHRHYIIRRRRLHSQPRGMSII